MALCLIVARTRNHVIGAKGGMPWHLPADLAYFKRTTMGCPIIMGRKTWASIGRPLPGRRNIVVTRDTAGSQAAAIRAAGAEVAASVEEAVSLAAGASNIFVIGGGEIYRAALPLADWLYITEIAATIDGDTLFEFQENAFEKTGETHHAADEKNAHSMTFTVWRRRGSV
jgi:dihydrofolate reductase